jgi:hypothetical protein
MTVPKSTPTFNDDPGAFDEDAISENDALNAHPFLTPCEAGILVL